MRWQSAIQERCRSLESFRLFNGCSRQELGRAGKDCHVLPPAVVNAEKQFLNVQELEILDWSFFYPDGLKIERVEDQTRGGRSNNVQISMYEQRGQIEQAKHRLRTLLHLMVHKRHRHRDLAKAVSTQRYARGWSVPSMTPVSSQSKTELTETR